MNVLFLTLVEISTLGELGIYTDLLREFVKDGHQVHVICPVERRNAAKTTLIREKNAEILRVKTGNITKTSLIEKGISTVTLQYFLIWAIRKFFSNVKFDLVLYSTPPITLTGVIRWIKKRDYSRTYLLLKDIFPQNAVDLGMLRTTGWKAPLYHYFRRKEKQLYALSDRIGCMSPANVAYVLKHNPEISQVRVEVSPNSIEPRSLWLDETGKRLVRERYRLPHDKCIFVYGGNLGRPQAIQHVVRCLKVCENLDEAFFVIAGSGTDFGVLDAYVKNYQPKHVLLLSTLTASDFDYLLSACDVGLIFLDYRFTIPNFPSRLLSYMQASLPVLACTDINTDMGMIIERNGFGWWCESKSPSAFVASVRDALADKNRKVKGAKALEYMRANYSVSAAYHGIIESLRAN